MDKIRKPKPLNTVQSEKTTKRKKKTSVNILLACGKSSGELIHY